MLCKVFEISTDSRLICCLAECLRFCGNDRRGRRKAQILFSRRGLLSCSKHHPASLTTSSNSTACLQVSQHNAPQDCWVTILGEVFDITPLVKVLEQLQLFCWQSAEVYLKVCCVMLTGSTRCCGSPADSSCWYRHISLVRIVNNCLSPLRHA